jgi:Ca-activated chloride channel homolog
MAQRRRFALGCTAVVVLSAILGTRLFAQDDKPLRLDVKLVNIFVNVTDKTGAIVGQLTQDDFKVFEDGRPQKIAHFERQSEMPLNLTLAIDTSSSTFKDRGIEQQAAKKFVSALIRTQDRMSVIQFNTYVDELTGFTNNVMQLDRGLDHMHGAGGTALYDAIYLGSRGLGKREGRKVLVLVSDGGDTVKGTSYEDALEQALRNEVMIYSIIDVPIEASAGRDLGGEHAMIQLSQDTGGKSFYAYEGGLDKAFQRVSEDLRTQYLIGYYPKSQEPGREFHRIEVTIPRAAPDEFNVRHKTGYYGDAQKSRDD